MIKKCLLLLLCCYHIEMMADGGINVGEGVAGIAILLSFGAYGVSSEVVKWATRIKPVTSCRDCGELGKNANTLTSLSCGHSMCLICKQKRLEDWHSKDLSWQESPWKDICCSKLVQPACGCKRSDNFFKKN